MDIHDIFPADICALLKKIDDDDWRFTAPVYACGELVNAVSYSLDYHHTINAFSDGVVTLFLNRSMIHWDQRKPIDPKFLKIGKKWCDIIFLNGEQNPKGIPIEEFINLAKRHVDGDIALKLLDDLCENDEDNTDNTLSYCINALDAMVQNINQEKKKSFIVTNKGRWISDLNNFYEWSDDRTKAVRMSMDEICDHSLNKRWPDGIFVVLCDD